MTKPVVILVHGMGKYPVGDFKKEFVESLNESLNKYKGFKSKKIETLIDLVEINYDGFFDEMRKKMADRAKPMAQRLAEIGAVHNLSFGPEIALKLTGLEAKYNDDEFLYTHVLDVFFYATLLGGKVRVDVAKTLAETMLKHSTAPIHIVAHSLGTAVIHDTLAKLYRGDFNAVDSIPDLDVLVHRLDSVWMIANVSKLVNKLTNITDPLQSTVKPTPEGCTNTMRNVHHQLDPFTLIEPFNPENDGEWIPTDEYDSNFKDITTSAITNLNTHSFGDYVKNPKVTVPLLRQLINFRPDDADEVHQEYLKTTIAGAYDELKEEIDDLDLSKPATFKSFSKAAISFAATVNALKQ